MQWGSWLIYAQHEHLEMLGPAERRLSPLFVPQFVPMRGHETVGVKKQGALWLVQRDLCSPKMRWVASPQVTGR